MKNSKKTTEKKKNDKKYVKSINFASIVLEPSLISTSNKSEAVKEALEKAFENKSNIDLQNSIVVEKISATNDGFFGVLKRNSSINDVLTEIRDKKTNSLIEADDLIFSHYTYFYIDYNSLFISYIKTKNFQNIEFIIGTLFNKATILNTSIYPIRKEEQEIKAIAATGVSMKFTNPEKFVELVDTNKIDAKVEMMDVNLRFSAPNANIVKKLLDIIKKNPKDVKKVSVFNDAETTDLLRSIFTREAIIELSEDDRENLDRICKLLKVELLKIINA